jgi:dodecin
MDQMLIPELGPSRRDHAGGDVPVGLVTWVDLREHRRDCCGATSAPPRRTYRIRGDRGIAFAPSGAGGREGCGMSVYRVIDVIGTSNESWEDAAATAIRTASQSVRDLRVGEVVEQDIHVADDGAFVYRTKLRLSFKYETQ